MSWPVSVVVVLGFDHEHKTINQIKEFSWVRDKDFSLDADLRLIDRKLAGGTKYMGHDVYMGGFNYLPIDKFMDHLRTVEWGSPEDSCVVIADNNSDEYLTVYRPYVNKVL